MRSSRHPKHELFSFKKRVSLLAVVVISLKSIGLAMGSEECGMDGSCQPKDCHDLHELCHGWALDGECVLNPKYMRSACPRSCSLCYEESDSSSVDSVTFNRVKVFSQMNIGVDQNVPTEPGREREKVIQVMKSMDTYSKVKVTEPVMDDYRQFCLNKDANCAFWASTDECTKNNAFMVVNCPLACQICSSIPIFQRCSSFKETTKTSIDAMTPNVLVQAALHSSTDYEIISNGQDGDLPWIILWDNFLTEKDCDDLTSLFEEESWTIQQEDPPQESFHRHNYQIATCDSSCENQTISKQVKTQIASLLNIPTSNLASFDMIQLNRGQSTSPQHDILPQHSWLPAGPRVLTLLLCLASSDEGGAVGFPDLNWTYIKLKKGQAILWSNVLENSPTNKHPKMMSELLPVVSGQNIFAKIYIHAAEWQKEKARGCT